MVLKMMEDKKADSPYKNNVLRQDKLLWIAREYQKQGIKYVEIADTVLTKKGLPAIELLEDLHEIMPKIEEETGVAIRFLFAIRRIPLTIINEDSTNSEYLRENLIVLKAISKSPYVVGSDFIGEEINDITELKPVIERIVQYVESEDGYIIDIDDFVTVYADTERAKLYAVHTILDAYEGCLKKAVVYHYPIVPYRSARVYLPAKKELTYFKKFIDMLCFMGYNAIVLEIGGAMEYKRHPEINETWAAYCKSMQEFNEKPLKASNVYYRTKNSVHTYNGGGDIYTQQEMRELASYCAERFIEIIPEVPSLTHSEYFLISHPELRECQDEPFASTAAS